MKKSITIFLVMVLVVSFIQITAFADNGYRDTVYAGYDNDVDSFDPYGSTGALVQIFTNLTFDRLVINNADTGELDAQLATAWEDKNGDGKDWQIHLVENAVSHDGKPFTAEDVKFTWEYAAAGAGNVIKPISAMDYVDSIEIVDDYTLIYHLKYSMYDFPTYLEQPIYSKEAFESMDPADAGAIGFGPYYYNESLRQSGVQFGATRFDEYWEGIEKYPTKNIVFKILNSDGTHVAALEAGEIDFLFRSITSSYTRLCENDNLKGYSRTGANSYYLGMNFKSDKVDFGDVELRRALAQAIDKEAIVMIAWDEIGGVPSYNFCAPSGLGYTEVDAVQYDPEAAAAYISEKFPSGLTIRVLHYAANKAIAEVIQMCFDMVGITCELKQVDTTNWTAIKKEAKEFDMFVDYAAYQGALLYNFNRFFYTNGSSNMCGYYSAEYEEMQDKVTNASSYEGMLQEFAVLQQWVADNMPLIPLGYANSLGVTQKNVEGFELAPTNNYMNFRTVYIPE